MPLNRREAGQWMTAGNPFYAEAFCEWFDAALADILKRKNKIKACEPYAGKLGLVAHLNTINRSQNIDWDAYDISPADANELLVKNIDIMKRDTLLNLPDHYDLIVTNPPYLARNSARRRGLSFPFDADGTGIKRPSDLYQFALDTCLNNSDYCVMLIPESFITSRYDKTRCDAIISLRGDLFDDTDCPVCLALFSPHGNDKALGPLIYDSDGKQIGYLLDIKQRSSELIGKSEHKLTMNDPNGNIALIAIDSTNGKTIRFAEQNAVEKSAVKTTSRSLTRISCCDGNLLDKRVIDESNRLLNEWRDVTGDILMTAFKGTRKDGKYRRRLSFSCAEKILSQALTNIEQEDSAE